MVQRVKQKQQRAMTRKPQSQLNANHDASLLTSTTVTFVNLLKTQTMVVVAAQPAALTSMSSPTTNRMETKSLLD